MAFSDDEIQAFYEAETTRFQAPVYDQVNNAMAGGYRVMWRKDTHKAKTRPNQFAFAWE